MEKKESTDPRAEADFSQNPPTETSDMDTDVEAEARKMGTNPDEWMSREGAE